MSQRQVFSTIFVTLFVALMGWLLLVIKPFLTTIAWAIILARLAYPLHARVRRHLTGRETMAALISTVTLTLLVVLPSMYVVIFGVQESLEAYNALSAWLQQDGLQRAGDSLSRVPVLGRLSQRFLGGVIVAHGNVELSIVEATKWLSTFVVTGAAVSSRTWCWWGPTFSLCS